jgi:TonB family protein
MIEPIQHKEIERLLRLLRSRDLSESEWSQLEIHAANDPFLSDAIEGLRLVPAETRIIHIQSILYRLSTATRKRKTVLGMSPWISIAASVLLLAGMIWLINRFSPTSDVIQVAENVTHDEESNQNYPTSGGDTSLLAESLTVERSNEAESLVDVSTMRPTAALSKEISEERKAEDSDITSAPSISESRGMESHDHPRSDSALVEKAENQTIAQPARPLGATGNAADYLTVSDPEVKGIVMNYIGEPVGGAQIQIKGTAVQTKTDYLGNFALDIPNQNYRNALVISHEEYPPVEADVSDGDSIVVRLRETVSDGKSDVITLSQRRMSTAAGPGSRSLAQPLAGERSYNKYLRQNLRYPSEASKAGIRGSVIVEFDLSTDGFPQNFRIVRSLGYGCDEEAIRLIREGPKWNVAGAQVPIGRWEVVFQ